MGMRSRNLDNVILLMQDVRIDFSNLFKMVHRGLEADPELYFVLTFIGISPSTSKNCITFETVAKGSATNSSKIKIFTLSLPNVSINSFTRSAYNPISTYKCDIPQPLSVRL